VLEDSEDVSGDSRTRATLRFEQIGDDFQPLRCKNEFTEPVAHHNFAVCTLSAHIRMARDVEKQIRNNVDGI